MFCKVNSGSSVLFWHDNLTDLGPLIDLTGANGPRVTRIHKMATVNQACHASSWSIFRGRHPILRLLRDCLPVGLPASLSTLQDVFLWKNAPAAPLGDFSPRPKHGTIFIRLVTLSPGLNRFGLRNESLNMRSLCGLS